MGEAVRRGTIAIGCLEAQWHFANWDQSKWRFHL